jgi:phosphopantothenoylcysteine decarboxylase/phosphopantothenate--cysteine ligase
MPQAKKNILLIVTGSIAAYKSAELVRMLKKLSFNITCIMTKESKEFITPLTLASLSENVVYDDIFSLKDEVEMGHINLSRQADLILIAPATCNILAKIANGFADDLASTLLIAANKPILIAPAMNVEMWNNKATKRNVEQLRQDGAIIIGPDSGVLACNEEGQGRMADLNEIVEQVKNSLNYGSK